MSVLVGGVAGASARLSGGLSSSALAVADVQPTPLQRVRPSLGTKDSPGISRFRRHITWTMTDLLLAPLVGATVLVYDWTTKLLAAQLTTDAAGVVDFAVYTEGTTYFLYANKAGAPEVFGATSNQVAPV
jgi:hypothetical protein